MNYTNKQDLYQATTKSHKQQTLGIFPGIYYALNITS